MRELKKKCEHMQKGLWMVRTQLEGSFRFGMTVVFGTSV
jgi:hypothetical protein